MEDRHFPEVLIKSGGSRSVFIVANNKGKAQLPGLIGKQSAEILASNGSVLRIAPNSRGVDGGDVGVDCLVADVSNCRNLALQFVSLGGGGEC